MPENRCLNFSSSSTFVYTAYKVPACQVCLPTADPSFLTLPSEADHLMGTGILSPSTWSRKGLIKTPPLCPGVPIQAHKKTYMHLTLLLLSKSQKKKEKKILSSSFLVSDNTIK